MNRYATAIANSHLLSSIPAKIIRGKLIYYLEIYRMKDKFFASYKGGSRNIVKADALSLNALLIKIKTKLVDITNP